MKREPSPKRTQRIFIRVTDTEKALIRMKMEENGYASVSSYLRGILQKSSTRLSRPSSSVQEADLDRHFRQTVFEINRIGNNYNQVVKLWQTQAKILEGSPSAGDSESARTIDRRMTSLMSLTVQVRDELALLIDKVSRYYEPTQ